MAVLERTYLLQKIGTENIYEDLPTAVCVLHKRAHDQAGTEPCSMLTLTGNEGTTEEDIEELLQCR